MNYVVQSLQGQVEVELGLVKWAFSSMLKLCNWLIIRPMSWYLLNNEEKAQGVDDNKMSKILMVVYSIVFFIWPNKVIILMTFFFIIYVV